MKIAALLVLALLAFSPAAWASPFLVCDPYGVGDYQPTEFRITYGTVTVISPAETLPDGSRWLHWDLEALPPGTYNLNVVAAIVDPIWGDMVSDPTPFTFTKPAPGILHIPVNIKLAK